MTGRHPTVFPLAHPATDVLGHLFPVAPLTPVTAVTPVTTGLLEIEGLRVSYRLAGKRRTVVEDIGLTVAPGEVVALVGSSGSGKSTIAQAILGLLPGTGRIESGAIRFEGEDILGWPDRRLSALRGARISLVPQDPAVSLNPVWTIGAQLAEMFRIHGQSGRIADGVPDLLARVGLPDPRDLAKRYPHELSGGMRQRVLIAIAIALHPRLIVADEPTSALDVTHQRRILDLIDDLRAADRTAMLLVTHDLGVARDRADRVVILKDGRIVEQGPAAEVLTRPRSPVARRLLADRACLALPQARAPRDATATPPGGEPDDAIVVDRLVHRFAGAPGAPALDGLSFRVRRGTTHALVGESGSGKTTTVRAVMGLLRPDGGRVLINGRDLSALKGRDLRLARRDIQLVYQNPYSSLDPRQTIGEIIGEPLRNFGLWPQQRQKIAEMTDRVRLPRDVLPRQPADLSGGQRQRVAIARALILSPGILVLDEAVSAQDVSVQAEILTLLEELQRDLGLTYLFVSHDLAVVRRISDSVSVLHRGVPVEAGPTALVFDHPVSPFTRELIDAIPGRRPPLRPGPVPAAPIPQEDSVS